jgi:hypothetical protein
MCNWRSLLYIICNLHRICPCTIEELDWRVLDHNDRSLWPAGVTTLSGYADRPRSLATATDDSLLEQIVKERTYNYRNLISGVIQHGHLSPGANCAYHEAG